MKTASTLALALAFLAAPSAAQVPTDPAPVAQAAQVLVSRSDDLARVLRGEADASSTFGPQFLAQVPSERLTALMRSLETQYGAFIGVDDVVPTDDFSGTISLRFERAVVSGPITLDPAPPHLVAGLLLSTITPVDDSLEKVSADLRALPGTVSVLFAPLFDDGDPVLAMAADEQLAIGSTFKLYVLSALAHSIARGERDWSDVVRIDRASYPSGTMHLWPRGAPVTLQTLAIMMISNSDNTATDILLHHLGRETVEAEVVASGHSQPERLQPFLGTLELFALKGSPQNRQKFIAADPAERRRILADFEDDVNGDPAGIIPPRFTTPTAIDTIEWFASVEDIRKALARIASLEDPVARQIMAIAPSLPDETVQTFAFVGYKGGSEPGVLNLSWLLRDDANDWHVLSMTWNDHDNALQSGTLEVIGQRLLTLSR